MAAIQNLTGLAIPSVIEGGARIGSTSRACSARVQVRRGDPERAGAPPRGPTGCQREGWSHGRVQGLRLHGHCMVIASPPASVPVTSGNSWRPRRQSHPTSPRYGVRAALGHHRQRLRARLGQLEGEANDPSHSGSRHDGNVGGHLFLGRPCGRTTYAEYSPGVLSHDLHPRA